jgi:hypothetical protein
MGKSYKKNRKYKKSSQRRQHRKGQLRKGEQQNTPKDDKQTKLTKLIQLDQQNKQKTQQSNQPNQPNQTKRVSKSRRKKLNQEIARAYSDVPTIFPNQIQDITYIPPIIQVSIPKQIQIIKQPKQPKQENTKPQLEIPKDTSPSISPIPSPTAFLGSPSIQIDQESQESQESQTFVSIAEQTSQSSGCIIL